MRVLFWVSVFLVVAAGCDSNDGQPKATGDIGRMFGPPRSDYPSYDSPADNSEWQRWHRENRRRNAMQSGKLDNK